MLGNGHVRFGGRPSGKGPALTLVPRRSAEPTRILAEEFLYARTWSNEQQRTNALAIWNIHYNYHRPHTTTGNQPPASRLHTGVTNLAASYS
jgi:transposase InsO family protein